MALLCSYAMGADNHLTVVPANAGGDGDTAEEHSDDDSDDITPNHGVLR